MSSVNLNMTAFSSATQTSWLRLEREFLSIYSIPCVSSIIYIPYMCCAQCFDFQSIHIQDDEDHQGQEVESFEVSFCGLFEKNKTETWAKPVVYHEVMTDTQAHKILFATCLRRRRWWNRSCFISKPDYIVVELLKWSCRPSVEAEVCKKKRLGEKD